MAKKKTATKTAATRELMKPAGFVSSKKAAAKKAPLRVGADAHNKLALAVIAQRNKIATLEAALNQHVSQLATSIGTIQEKVAPLIVAVERFTEHDVKIGLLRSASADITGTFNVVQKALVALHAQVAAHQERLDELKKFDQYIYDAVKRHEEERHPDVLAASAPPPSDPAPKQPLDVVAVPSLAERALAYALKEEKKDDRAEPDV